MLPLLACRPGQTAKQPVDKVWASIDFNHEKNIGHMKLDRPFCDSQDFCDLPVGKAANEPSLPAVLTLRHPEFARKRAQYRRVVSPRISKVRPTLRTGTRSRLKLAARLA